MEIEWRIDDDDIARVKALLDDQAGNPLVRKRQVRNLAKAKSPVDRHQFWFQMTGMRLTSVQRSGPNSHVARFIRTTPFPLAYDTLCGEASIERLIAREIRNAGGIRFADDIARQLTANFHRLGAGEWDEALRQCNRLTSLASRDIEKNVADYIDTYQGFGPKQSRNFLQALGLTRFEIPIDSRVTEWLNRFGFPVRLSAAALADPHYYEFVSDGIQALCAKCGVFPCILDAAIFALKDGDAWTEANIVY